MRKRDIHEVGVVRIKNKRSGPVLRVATASHRPQPVGARMDFVVAGPVSPGLVLTPPEYLRTV
ncbi:MAG: hypothetical protein A3K59_09110 [Euryarchaeota archaeon RBG_19FT_COMBO_69_17]|nr:MAG: hypothetical protein A3K59_09110 [Euryarchaeota archaeon RBG_19FT_COMBO_69_17]